MIADDLTPQPGSPLARYVDAFRDDEPGAEPEDPAALAQFIVATAFEVEAQRRPDVPPEGAAQAVAERLGSGLTAEDILRITLRNLSAPKRAAEPIRERMERLRPLALRHFAEVMDRVDEKQRR